VGLEAIGGKCVWSSEIDPDARLVYRANFGGEEPHADIRTCDPSSIPAFDLLTAGFPCQDFSKLGDQKGLDGARGTLFWELIRVLKHCKPPVFLLENVKGLIRMSNGKVFATCVEALKSCGYTVKHKVINSKSMVPQFRQRVYFIGFRNAELGKGFQFPRFPEISPQHSVADALHDPSDPFLETFQILETQWRSILRSKRTKKFGLHRRLLTSHDNDRVANTLIRNFRTDWKGISQMVYENRDELIGQRRVEGKDMPSGTNDSIRPRWLTPREFARIMGFPENFRVHPDKNFAREQLGNAVTPPVIAVLGGAIISSWIKYSRFCVSSSAPSKSPMCECADGIRAGIRLSAGARSRTKRAEFMSRKIRVFAYASTQADKSEVEMCGTITSYHGSVSEFLGRKNFEVCLNQRPPPKAIRTISFIASSIVSLLLVVTIFRSNVPTPNLPP